MKPGALQGITVIDLSRLLPGPFCSMILADHGARVICIEDKRYEAEGLFVSDVNRNKEHMTLNLKSDEGKSIFFQLVKDADVVLEGFRPGVVTKLGVDYQAVSQINPKIIYCSVTGYGQTGAHKDRAGHDINYLSISGILDLIGGQNTPPSIPGVQFADMAAGGMNAAIGILLALQSRHQTGQGQYIDISMTDGMVSFLTIALFIYQLTGIMPERSNSLLSHRYACYNTYETSDNRYIAIGALENRFWTNLCHHFNVPEYIPIQFDETKRLEIISFMQDKFKTKTLIEWEQELSEIDVCASGVQNLKEVLIDPYLKEREMVIEKNDSDGKSHYLFGIPVKLSDTPGQIKTSGIQFGQSTNKILNELGYSDLDIQRMRQNNII